MNIFNGLLKGEGAQKMLLEQFAERLRKDGVTQMIIDIPAKGEINIISVNNNVNGYTLVKSDEYRYLLDFFKQKCELTEQEKTKILLNNKNKIE